MGIEDLENCSSIAAVSYNDFIFPNNISEGSEMILQYDKLSRSFHSNNISLEKNDIDSKNECKNEDKEKQYETIHSFIFPNPLIFEEPQNDDFFFKDNNSFIKNNFDSFHEDKESIKQRHNIFIINKDNEQSTLKSTGLNGLMQKNKNHTKETSDNISKKIKKQLIKFILSFLTDLVPIFWKGRMIKFRQINSSYIPINQSSNKEFFGTIIKDLLQKPISNKYSKKINQNEINANKIKKIPQINALLKMTIGKWYTDLFMRDKQKVMTMYNNSKCKTLFFSDYIQKYQCKERNDYIKAYRNISQSFISIIYN